jgi:hypothetical protein
MWRKKINTERVKTNFSIKKEVFEKIVKYKEEFWVTQVFLIDKILEEYFNK